MDKRTQKSSVKGHFPSFFINYPIKPTNNLLCAIYVQRQKNNSEHYFRVRCTSTTKHHHPLIQPT